MPASKTIAELKKESGGDGKAVVDPKTMNPRQKVKYYLDAYQPQIAQALPKHVSPDRMLRVAYTAIINTPKLMNCDMASLIGSIMHCAQLGLEPNTPMGHAYLVPYGSKAQVILGYRGMIDLARRSGQIISIAARAVRENDDFHYSYGLDETLLHVPAAEDRGEIIRFYAVAKLVGGGHAFEVMSVQQVKEIQAKSKAGGSGPWKEYFEEMGRKTVVRRLFKYLPVSVEMADAIDLDDRAAAKEDQPMPEGLDPLLELEEIAEDVAE